MTDKVKKLINRMPEHFCDQINVVEIRKLLLDCKAELERLEAENARYREALLEISNHPHPSDRNPFAIQNLANRALKQPPEGV